MSLVPQGLAFSFLLWLYPVWGAGVALVAAAPEKMRWGKASPRKGKEGWLEGVF